MKSFTLFLIMFVVAASVGYGQSMVKRTTETLGLTELTYDFGRIPQGKPVKHNFEVVNNGKKPLIIENVEASCGCTTPEWTAEPVAPGAKTVIKVGFNASSEGMFKKSITINYNGDETKTLIISGQVYPTPTTSAPINSSLSLLKQ